MPSLGRGLDVDVDRPAARTADESQRRGIEHLVGDGAAVHDQAVVVGQPLDDLLRRAGVLADAPFRIAAADASPLHVQLQVLEPVVAVEAIEGTPEHLDRHVRVADDQQLHSGIHPARLEVDCVARARLDDHLEQRLRVQVVELDRLADAAAHQHLGAEIGEVAAQVVGLLVGRAHAGDVMKPLASLLEPLLVDARPFERLQQLEHDRAGMTLGAEHRVLDRLAVQVRVVEHRRLVLVDVPRAPAEGLVVDLERLAEILDDGRDLRDRQASLVEFDASHARLLFRSGRRCRGGPARARRR